MPTKLPLLIILGLAMWLAQRAAHARADDLSGKPINFANQIVPILTKLGCNSGGCHGKQHGQNGFKLSLLGFEPELDYDALVKEARGRRVFPAAPERSLLLLKASAQVPHGGGLRFAVGSEDYEQIRRWIASGMPYGTPDDPKVVEIRVSPEQQTMSRSATQQIRVTAHYSDGSTEDVTRRAQYISNEPDGATVTEGGLVETTDLAGETAVMARYQGHVAVFRATVPTGRAIASYPEFPPENFVDSHMLAKWQSLGIVPSQLCSDSEFVRRATLDICGTLPTPDEVRAFLTSPGPLKRTKLVDQLLDRAEYADFFALKWADILHCKRQNLDYYREGTIRFHDWIREQFARNRPYNDFVRDILTAQGGPEEHPPAIWYRLVRQPNDYVDNTAQVFMGLRLQCAQCHHHPFEKWSQRDYYGLAAFFARIGKKKVIVPSSCFPPSSESLFTARSGEIRHPRTGEVMKPRGLDATPVDVPEDEDPRKRLVDWLEQSDNPFFARAIVNRMWGHFFGRGIVDPPDDMRVTNPPCNPELLDALAADFVQHGCDLKHLIRRICSSRTYSLSSVANEYNQHDRRNFSRYYPRRMQAEVLLDAVSQVTGVPTQFSGLPLGARAIELPDESVTSYFLDIFGRPARSTACECERNGEATLAQSLHLLNSAEVQGKLAADNGRSAQLAADSRSDSEKVTELFLWCHARLPAPEELERAVEFIASRDNDKRIAYSSLLWALMNMKEFQFNY